MYCYQFSFFTFFICAYYVIESKANRLCWICKKIIIIYTIIRIYIQVPLYIWKLLLLLIINHKIHPASHLSTFDSLIYNQILVFQVSYLPHYGFCIAIDSIFPANQSLAVCVLIVPADHPHICCKDKIWKIYERSSSFQSSVFHLVYRDNMQPYCVEGPKTLNLIHLYLKDNCLEYYYW